MQATVREAGQQAVGAVTHSAGSAMEPSVQATQQDSGAAGGDAQHTPTLQQQQQHQRESHNRVKSHLPAVGAETCGTDTSTHALHASTAAAAAPGSSQQGPGGQFWPHHQQQQHPPYSLDVAAQAHIWLQRLALLLVPAHPPPCISLADISRRVPVPPVVKRYYGAVDRFIAATPGLFWNGPSDHISLDPDLHRRLHTTGQQPPNLPAPSPAAPGATGTKGPGHQYQQQLGAVPGVQHPHLPANSAGGNTIVGPGHQFQQHLGAVAGVQHLHLPAPSPGAPGATGTKGPGHQYQQQQGAIARVQQRYLPATDVGGNTIESPGGQYQQQPGASAGVQQPYPPATGVGRSTIKSPGHQYQQQLGAVARVQQRYLPANGPPGVGPGGQQQQQKQSKRQLKKQRKKQRKKQQQQQQQQRQQPLSPAAAAAAAAERKAQAERMEAEGTAWMQRVALYLTPAVPPEKPPSISQQDIKKHVPIPQCLLDHYGSARAVTQSLTHLGLYWHGPLDNTPHVRIHHAQHVELRAAALAAGQLPPAAAAAGAGGWVAPAGTPGQVAAQAHGWLHWLAQRVPLTDPPQRVSRKLLYQEVPIPQPVVTHFQGRFLTAVPGLKQHNGSHDSPSVRLLALQPDLHRALLAEAATAAEGAGARQQGEQQFTGSSMDLAP